LIFPTFIFLFMPGSATLSQCCMVAAGSSPAHKFSASVNSTSDVTCIVDTSLPVCLISEAAATRCTLSVNSAQTIWVPAISNPNLISLGLAYNVPVAIDCLHYVLQFYVVKSSLVDIVLGQPFLHCASATLTYRADGEFDIIVSEPGQQSCYLLETFPVPNPWDAVQSPLGTPARGGVLHLGTADEIEPARTEHTLLERLHQWPPAPRCSLAERLSNQPRRQNCPATAPRLPDQGRSAVQ
jgi:hypothetical protein